MALPATAGANMSARVYREFMEQLVQAMEQKKLSDLWPISNVMSN
jgi:hypothetical protein